MRLKLISFQRFKLSEDEVAVFSAKRWDCRNREGLIESATPCNDAQVMGSYQGSNPFHLTVLTSRSEDYTTVPQHLHFLMLFTTNGEVSGNQ